jgi:hypothetical protein
VPLARSPARIIRGAAAIEAKLFRREGKPALRSFALTRQVKRSAVKPPVKRSNLLPSAEHDGETFGADAFARLFSWGSTSIDTLSLVLASMNNPNLIFQPCRSFLPIHSE